ncbi:MAG: RNA methyltransferase [Clostridium sp.]|jgi:TrmH family RNA methyltransferase|nr:RNA methyltransferase [Clostridium sp.]
MIESVANAKIKQLISWRDQSKQRRQDKVFLAEGIKLFLEAPIELIQSVYLTKQALDMLQQDNKLQCSGYELVSEAVYAKITDEKNPQGILTVLAQPDRQSLLDSHDEWPAQPFFLLLENLQDPGNLGTILRTAEAAGVHEIILSKDSADLYNPKVVRATMGSIFRLPCFYVDSIPEAIRVLARRRVTVAAAELAGSIAYDQGDYWGACAFVIGNEAKGLSPETLEAASLRIRIPMCGAVESLNAAMAAGILMYEACRQRNQVKVC